MQLSPLIEKLPFVAETRAIHNCLQMQRMSDPGAPRSTWDICNTSKAQGTSWKWRGEVKRLRTSTEQWSCLLDKGFCSHELATIWLPMWDLQRTHQLTCRTWVEENSIRPQLWGRASGSRWLLREGEPGFCLFVVCCAVVSILSGYLYIRANKTDTDETQWVVYMRQKINQKKGLQNQRGG